MRTHKLFAGLLMAFALASAGGADTRIDHSAEYDACMVLTGRAPSDALASARSWEEAGGGNAARHCAAIALFNLRDYSEAAMRLDALDDLHRAEALAPGLAEIHLLKAALRFQGDATNALAEAERAAAAAPGNPDVFLERGNIKWLLEDHGGARRDWSQVLSLAPDSAAAQAARNNLARLE